MIRKVAARPSRPVEQTPGWGPRKGSRGVGGVLPKLGAASLTLRDITKEGRVSARAFRKVEFLKVEANVANEGLFFFFFQKRELELVGRRLNAVETPLHVSHEDILNVQVGEGPARDVPSAARLLKQG